MYKRYHMKLVQKPWGSEYVLWEDEYVSLWHLSISPGQCTSLHCHPSKKTGLLVLNGAGRIQFLNSEQSIFDGDRIIIRNGMFHRTLNTSNRTLELLEIETPNNKIDIIRLLDEYDRAGQPYEDNMEDKTTVTIPTEFGNKYVGFLDINSIEDIESLQENDKIIGIAPIISFQEHEVMGRADIVSPATLLKLAKQFGVNKCTAILVKTN